MAASLEPLSEESINNNNIDAFVSRTYDFVIIGGGTAGLVLANRLSEDQDLQIAVLEAGRAKLNDVRIKLPAMAPSFLNNPQYDWCFKTVPQEQLGGRTDNQHRGKLLGGTSGINFMMTTYSSTEGLDTWEKLGNKGWSAKDVNPYLHKFQTWNAPSESTKKLFGLETTTVQDSLDESNGPIQTGMYQHLGPLEGDFVKTFRALDATSTLTDPVNGLTKGAYPISTTVDPKSAERSYAVSGYYLPISHRKNLHVLTDAHVTEILFDGTRATGVAFIHDSQAHKISATAEVILSAGAIQSPQILELSGVGSADILRKHNITAVAVNEAVGSNLQDHINAALPFPPSHPDLALFSDPALVGKAMEEHSKTASGPLSKFIGSSAFISLKDILSVTETTATNPDEFLSNYLPGEPLLSNQDLLIKDLLTGIGGASTQFMIVPSYLRPPSRNTAGHTVVVSLMHPFSSGTVHIGSPDPLAAPLIDPKYFSHPADREILARSLQYAEQAIRTPPLSSHVAEHERKFPSGEKGLQAAREYLTQWAKSTWHPCGTCAMLPLDQGGVVDTEFRVYGVNGLRVVDASVFPMVPQGNPQTLVYAVAEKAADIIMQSLA